MQELGFTATIAAPFLAAKEQVTRALAAEGFGVLTHIDVTATLQAKLGEKMEPYEILGACNPALAHAALSVHRNIGLLLPCNVVLREVGEATEVSIVNPRAMFGAVPDGARASLDGVVHEAHARLARVAAALKGEADGGAAAG